MMGHYRRMRNQTIEKGRQLVTSGELTRAGRARAAGLHANTLRDCTDEGWNPTAETLAKIESFLLHNDESPVLVGIEEIIDEARRSEEHTSELQSLMRISYAVFCLKKKTKQLNIIHHGIHIKQHAIPQKSARQL